MASIARFFLFILASASGCASASDGPELLTIPASQYAAAFDASIASSREFNMPAQFRDRRAGVIESDARFAGSLLESWRNDNSSLKQASENTLTFQRRRARFEFTPVGFHPENEPQPSSLQGPDIAGVGQPQLDLTQTTGELELRVWVYLERASTPGVRRSTWTRSKTTVARLVIPEGESGIVTGTNWVPITRDQAYERRLLASVQEALNASNSPQ